MGTTPEPSPGEPIAGPEARQTADGELVSLLAEFDEALLRGSLDDTSRLIQTIGNETYDDPLRSHHEFLALLHEIARADRPIPSAIHKGEDNAPLPKAFGRFEILGELGRGGQGVVFLAFDPALKRRVAVKAPRLDTIASPELQRRFLNEARIAARLTHPNIVAVHDVVQEGPICYIAAALCEGPVLSKWLEHRNGIIPQREAARLIEALAAAVDYAHRHGIIHRDLKPGNVLLEPSQSLSTDALAAPLSQFTPKLTDFGLARLVEKGEEQTRTGAVVGTPAYMAPEQAEGRAEKIGTGTDIYGLGCLLYELLVGKPPIRGTSDMDTLRRIAVDAPIPVRKDRPSIDRDLEAICLKCLEKDISKRYLSAADLSEDLRRYLAGEATIARPISPLDAIGRLARKYPVTSLFAAIALGLLLALTAGSVFAVFQISDARKFAEEKALHEAEARSAAEEAFQRERAQRSRAESAEKDAQSSAERAESEARSAKVVSDFLVRLFQTSDPWTDAQAGFRAPNEIIRKTSIIDVLDRASQTIGAELKDQPRERAQILSVIGNANRSLGRLDQAEQMLRESAELRKNHLPANHPERANSVFQLGWLLHDRGQFKEAEPLFRETLEIQTATHGRESLESATTMFHLAWTLISDPMERGIYKSEAEQLFTESLRIRKEKLGAGHRETMTAMAGLIAYHMTFDEQDKAIARIIETARMRAKTEDGRELIKAIGLYQRAVVYRSQKRYLQAQPLMRAAIEIARKQLGEHPALALLLGDYAGLCRQIMEFEKAETAIREAISLAKKFTPNGHPELSKAMKEFAHVLIGRGDHAEAQQLLDEALAISKRFHGEEDRRVAEIEIERCRLTYLRGQFEDALQQLAALRPFIERSVLGPWEKSLPNYIVAEIHADMGNWDAFEKTFEGARSAESASVRSRLLLRYGRIDQVDLETFISFNFLAPVYEPDNLPDIESGIEKSLALIAMGRREEARDLLVRWREIALKFVARGDCALGWLDHLLGHTYLELGDPQEAEQYLKSGYEILLKSRSSRSTFTKNAKEDLVKCFRALGREKDAEKLLKSDML